MLYNIITEQFQSTPSTRRETMFARYSINWAGISIHSLHTEGDERHRSVSLHQGHFNPLPPHGGRRIVLFSGGFCCRYFNPLPPHGGRPFTLYFHGRGYTLFQSTPSTRRETIVAQAFKFSNTFQSTPSTRRETVYACVREITKTFQSTPSTRRETFKK